MDDLLEILRSNCRESVDDIAKMLNLTPEEVSSRIKDLEEKGVIRGYRAIIHEDRLNKEQVTALIEVKVTPQRKDGFDHVAKRIAEFAKDKGINSIYIKIRAQTNSPGTGPGAYSVVKTLTKEGFKIISIADTTPIPRGGPKKKGGRRGRRV